MAEDKELRALSQLSEGAQQMLGALHGNPYIPKNTVQHQWPAESRMALQELIDAGFVEEMVVYRLISR